MELPALTSPERLLWLLPAAALLWWLAQPPRPRQALFTAHSAQWRLAMERARRRPPRFRALRWLLAVLACAMLALAATEPVSAGGKGVQRVVFLLDGSASAAARDLDGVSAFEAACRRVREESRRIPQHVRVDAVVARSGSLERWSDDSARLLAAPGEPGGALPAPLSELASALAADRVAVWAIGDGQAPHGLPPSESLWTQVGRSAPNMALQAAELEDAWPSSRIRVRARVASYRDADVRGEVRIEGAVVAPAAREVEVAARGIAPIELEAERAATGGRVRVSIRFADDALALDDFCEFELPPLPQTRIAVQAEEEGPGFAAAAGVSLAAAVGGAVVDAAPGQPVGFLLVEGGEGALSADPGPLLAFGRKREGAQPWPSPLVVDWDRADPVLAGLDLSELEIEHALRRSLPAGRTLLQGQLPDGSTAPLAVVEEGARGKAYHFCFRLQDSNLGLLAAFPQMLLRCFEQSQPGSRGVVQRTNEVPAAESDLAALPLAPERADVQWAARTADLSAWCAALALALLALRSGVR